MKVQVQFSTTDFKSILVPAQTLSHVKLVVASFFYELYLLAIIMQGLPMAVPSAEVRLTSTVLARNGGD